MIFILKTYTTTSIEYNVIQLMFSKEMAAQPRQVSNLTFIINCLDSFAQPWWKYNTINKTLF
jgi:hypothetical protein